MVPFETHDWNLQIAMKFLWDSSLHGNFGGFLTLGPNSENSVESLCHLVPVFCVTSSYESFLCFNSYRNAIDTQLQSHVFSIPVFSTILQFKGSLRVLEDA
jgi:hypothetical protein